MAQSKSPIFIKRFFVLDFDRTIGDTNALYQLFQSVISVKTHITTDQLDRARGEVEKSGGSFDTISYVQALLKEPGHPHDWQDVIDDFVKKASHDNFLEPGARELLDFLDDNHEAYGIVTFGGDRWQRLKVRAAGLDSVPTIVIGTHGKGSFLASWQQPDGTFHIPEDLTRGVSTASAKLVLIDDNAANFDNFPSHADGFCLVNRTGRDHVVPELPAQVSPINSLYEVITQLNHNIDKA